MYKMMDMRGIDSSGNNLADAYLEGVVTVNELDRRVYNNLYRYPYLTVNYTNVGDYQYELFVQQSSKFTSYVDDVITNIGYSAFSYFDNLATVRTPNVTSIAGRAFMGNTGVTVLAFPNLTSATTNDAFRDCTNLTAIDFGPDFGSLAGTNVFNGSNALATIILRKSNGGVGLGNTNSITRSSTTIYIPKALYDRLGDGTSLDYKAATNWSTLDSGGKLVWAQIEGSQYETHYADGTSIQ